MNMNKVLYWVALAAVAFGLSSEYQRGGFARLHSLAEYTEARLFSVATQAEHSLLALGILPIHARPSSTQEAMLRSDQIGRVLELHKAELGRAIALHEAELERAEARIARAQAIMAHTDLARMQVLAAPHFKVIKDADHRAITICSKSGRHVRIESSPDMSDLDIDMPEIETGDQF